MSADLSIDQIERMQGELASTMRLRLLDCAYVLDRLPALVLAERNKRGLGLREAAAEAGIAFNTFYRLERGRPITMPHVIPVLRWLAGASS